MLFDDNSKQLYITFSKHAISLILENLKAENERIKREVAALKKFDFAPGVIVDLKPIYSLADQKAENSKNENPCSQRCPKCHQLPWEYKNRDQDPLSTDGDSYDGFYSPESLFDLTFSLLHVDLNSYKVDNIADSNFRLGINNN